MPNGQIRYWDAPAARSACCGRQGFKTSSAIGHGRRPIGFRCFGCRQACAGHGITCSLHGRLIVSNAGSTGTSSVNLQMTRETEQGVQTFSHDAIPLAGGDTAELQFGNWTNTSQGIPLVTTHNGQQTTQTLTNQ